MKIQSCWTGQLCTKWQKNCNDFFSNIITNLDIPESIKGEPVSENIDDL